MANTKSVRETRREFSRLLDAAERGDVTVITRRGRPVAALMPIHEQKVSVRRQTTQRNEPAKQTGAERAQGRHAKLDADEGRSR